MSNIITVELGPDADTTLLSTFPTSTSGSAAAISTSDPIAVGLMKFDLSSIPADAVVLAARLHLTGYLIGTVGTTNKIHRMVQSWVEAEATWNVYSTGNNWATAGANHTTNDYNNTDIGEITWGGDGVRTNTPITVSIVQGWVDGSITNVGVRITATNSNTLQWASKENATSLYRPILEIKYTTSDNLTLDNVSSISASLQEGGWRAIGSVYDQGNRVQWNQEMESWVRLYRGAAWEADPRLAFRGHILPEQWQKTFQSSTAPWRAFTAQEFLKRIELQGIFFAEAASPANDHQLTVGDTYGHIIEHLLGKSGQYGHWNGVIGVWPEGFCRLDIDKTNSAAAGVHDLKAGNFWSRMQEIARTETFILHVNKYNIITYEPNPMFGATLPTPVMTITSSHLLEPLQITPRNTEQVGQIILFGTTPGGAQISGKYPTDPTAGPVVVESGFVSTSNAQMNTIAERKYKYTNRDVSVVAKLRGCMGLLFEIVDRVSVTYSSSSDGVAWSAKKFWIESIDVQPRDAFSGSTTMRLEAENA